MPEPRRRFWQIHLSTAIVLMFLAGGIILVNTCSYDRPSKLQIDGYGFPFCGVEVLQLEPPRVRLLLQGLLGDVACFVFSIVTAAALCEYRIELWRRRRGSS